MKKALPAVCVVLCAALALGILLQAGAAALLRGALHKKFPGSEVRVAGCSRRSFPLASFPVSSFGLLIRYTAHSMYYPSDSGPLPAA